MQIAHRTSFLWLEITGKCQLECGHCYADSSPRGTHGAMAIDDWKRVISEAVGVGVRYVQFIGGEPTLHPRLAELVDHALAARLRVEVYSNLIRVTEHMWGTFARPGVSVATSYYGDDAVHHDAVTGRPGSHARTRASIREAVRRGIAVRVGVVDMNDAHRDQRGSNELVQLGVSRVSHDQVRALGRANRDNSHKIRQLCGHCATGVAAVSSSGEVWPCVFARWMSLGNVRMKKLGTLLDGYATQRARAEIAAIRGPEAYMPCDPSCCPSTMCDPQCSPSCSPSCAPAGNCTPSGNCIPNY